MRKLIYLPMAAIRCLKAQLKYSGKRENILNFEDQNRRRELCEPCELRDGDKCSECGCFLTEKTELRTEACPLDKWPEPKH